MRIEEDGGDIQEFKTSLEVFEEDHGISYNRINAPRRNASVTVQEISGCDARALGFVPARDLPSQHRHQARKDAPRAQGDKGKTKKSFG